MALDRPKPVEVGVTFGAGHAFAQSVLPQLFPTLWAYLSDTVWSDGSARSTSTITVFAEDGLVKLCLNDREGKRTCWSTGTSLEESAEALEQRLAAGTAEWRGIKPKWAGRKG